MKTLNKLLDLSHNRDDNLVTPLILEYFTLQNYLTDYQAMKYLEGKYQ